VTQSVGDGIIFSNKTGEIIFWNLGAEKILGYREDEMLGQPLSLIMPERFRGDAYRGNGAAALRGGAQKTRQFRVVSNLKSVQEVSKQRLAD
jgi:PAS domain S-box-containing protein